MSQVPAAALGFGFLARGSIVEVLAAIIGAQAHAKDGAGGQCVEAEQGYRFDGGRGIESRRCARFRKRQGRAAASVAPS